jgi:hypothetical protein
VFLKKKLLSAAIFIGSVFYCFRKILCRYFWRELCDNVENVNHSLAGGGQKENPKEMAVPLRQFQLQSMIIIKYLGKTVKGYLLRYQDVPPNCEEDCPDCHRKLYKHGRYYRFVITGRSIRRIPIYRRLCPACGKTFSLLPDFLYPYYVHSGWILQKAWTLRYIKEKSYKFIQTAIFFNETGGISYKTIKRWDCLWKDKKDSLIPLILNHLIDVHPIAFDFREIKPLSDEQTLLYLLPITWKLHHTTTYPFYGFFNWINQLIHRV